MDYREIRRIQDIMKTVRELQKLRETLQKVNDLRKQREMIRQFMEERKDQFWRGGKPSEQELENLREQAGYDKELWAEIVRELLGEPGPKS
jgi:hypothetical protein